LPAYEQNASGVRFETGRDNEAFDAFDDSEPETPDTGNAKFCPLYMTWN
jgi:hypothetical protein